MPMIRVLSAFVLSLAFCAPVLAQNKGEQDAAAVAKAEQEAADKPQGTVVDGPRNIRDFDPDDDSLAVDATNINLRKVFEDLGPDATLWFQHVQTLANPFFEGRAPGTRGGDIAAEYVEFFFREYGLEPAFPADDGGKLGEGASDVGRDRPGGGLASSDAPLTSFRQNFDFASPDPKVEMVKTSASINDKQLKSGDDFAVLAVSGNGSVTAPVTFVGYGIEEGQDGYTSFEENTDLSGRIALVLRYEPLNDEGHSRWAEARFSRFSGIRSKLAALVDRKAAGIILVNPPGAVDGATGLESLRQSARFGARLKVPVVQMTPEATERLLERADKDKRDLLTLRQLADEGEVKTIDFSDKAKVTLSTELNIDDRLHTQNVGAVLPGKGDLADEWIIIGAHYDHVGYGYTGAMPRNVGQLHPGADDNASGTAGLLLAAKRLAHDYETSPGGESRRSIMFIAFGAEEAGLYGSKHFVEHASVPAKNIYCMLNMDMIGRLRSRNLLVQGTGTAEEFDELLKPHFEASGLTISTTPSGRGPSDHSSFFTAGVPVLFMFTGEHGEYHKPSDRAYTVNPAGAVAVVDLIESIALDFASLAEALTYVARPGGRGGAAAAGGPAGGSRVRLGIMPAYNAELETGVQVEAVTEETSAAEAGIQAGDVLLAWNGEGLTGGQKLFEMLAKSEPGEIVKVTLQRGDKNLTVDVTLKAREGQ